MKTILFIFCLLFISSRVFFAQDTFSIVAVDSVTGEVGSAGASCVDLFQFGLPSDHFLGKLFPGIGAINTQAYYVPTNQNNATNRMDLGDSPSEIIDWLINNDVSGQPEIRQYGIAASSWGNKLPPGARRESFVRDAVLASLWCDHSWLRAIRNLEGNANQFWHSRSANHGY